MYKLAVLKNKLKVITCNIPATHGVTTGVFVGVGSRYESNKQAGVSHFLEHMFFKGTKSRPSPALIARSIEGVGGYTNAATSHDYTFYYNKMPAKYADFGLEILADMMNNSLFDKQAIEREKGVILEELNMMLDDPARYVHDLFMNLMWPGHPLGRDIIGTTKSIKGLKRDDFLAYIDENYGPQNIAIVAAGKVDHKRMVKKIEDYFGHMKAGKPSNFKKVKKGSQSKKILLHKKKTDQAHIVLGVEGIPYDSKEESVMSLMDVIIGTGMSSRLFLNIREERGLCYSIHSFVEKFQETGVFGVSAGLNTLKLDLALQAIIEEFGKLKKERVSKTELKEAKEYLRGNMSLQIDNTDNMAIWYGSQGLFYREIKTPEERIKELMAVTENDIIKLARKLLISDRLRLVVIGPFGKRDENRFKKIIYNLK